MTNISMRSTTMRKDFTGTGPVPPPRRITDGKEDKRIKRYLLAVFIFTILSAVLSRW